MSFKAIFVVSTLLCGVSALAQDLVSLTDVVNDFQANSISADGKYMDKVLAFNVKVSGVEKGADGRYYLSLLAPKHVRCYFNSDQNSTLSSLKRGDDVALRGICKGFDRDKGGNHLVFMECKFGLLDSSSEMESAILEVKKSLFILKGTKGSGSGFVAAIGGVKYLVSNFHVFDGNDNLKLIDCDNREVEPKSVKFAHDRDIALFELPEQDAYSPLSLQSEISGVPIGTPVRNYGNSAGGGVFTEIGGKVLGVGPSVIEVDAAFVSGNSGSPVLSFPSMKVLGVATYATFERGNWVMAGTRYAGAVRRYATRIDNIDIAKLETYDKAKFTAEEKSLRSLEDLLVVKAAALDNLKGIGNGSSASWADFQLYAGKIPDASKKFRLTQLIQQWNKELANLSVPAPNASQPKANSAKAIMEKAGGHSSGMGIAESSGASIQKIPYEDIDRLLFVGDPKPVFTYKRLQAQADLIAEASEDMRKSFKTCYENVKALLRK